MTWVIAHRGASAEERENTLPAFERAIELGADFVELDVQASSDGGLVVFHDLDLDRLTPRAARSGAGGGRAARARDPDARGGGRADARADRRDGGAEERRTSIRRHDSSARTVALLSEDDVVALVRAQRAARGAAPAARAPHHAARRLRRLDPGGCRLRVGRRLPRPARHARGIERARRLGLRTAVYTVNDAERMRTLAALGVDGVFTDCPGRAREALRPR